MKKVSIITPCYNGESYLDRYFTSIIQQTYRPLELVFVDDGSTDRTAEIAEQYKEKLSEAGVEFHCIRQENAGQAAAMNAGFRVFTGDYLIWCDSDDILLPENAEKKVNFMEANPQYGFAICRGRVVYEAEPEKLLGRLYRVRPEGEDSFFYDLIREKNMYFYPGLYIARRAAMERDIPGMQIYPSRLGQNWQILLPLALHEKCGYMEDDLFRYVIREKSHSHSEKDLQSRLGKYEKHRELLYYLLNHMEMDNREYYLRVARDQCLRKQLDELYRARAGKQLWQKYNEMKSAGCATKRDLLITLSGLFPPINWGYKIFRKIKSGTRA